MRSATISFVSAPNTPPKPSRKSIGTPITSATSASPNALDRARENASSWSAGYRAAGHAVHQHRDAQRLGQIQQRGLCVSPPHVGACHDDGPLRPGEQPTAAPGRCRPAWITVGGSSARRGRRRHGPHRRRGPSGSRRTTPREYRRRPTAARSASSISASDRVGRLRGRGEPRQRRDERHVVDLLQRTLPPAQRRRPTAEDHQRRLVLLRGGHRAHAVGDAGTGGQSRDPGQPGHLRPAFGGERGGLFVSRVDQPDVLGAAAVVDREQVAAREGEDRVDPAGPQPPGDQVSRVDRGTGASMLMAAA